MQRICKLGILVLCVMLFVGFNGFAQVVVDTIKKTDFNGIDSDSNGFITSEEMNDLYSQKFNHIDKNGDKILDVSELKAQSEKSFNDADKNGDGVVTEEEYVANKVGQPIVVPEEKKDLAAKVLNSGQGTTHELMDINNDGKVDKEEFAAHTAANFEKADTNGDKKITREENDAQFQDYINKVDANKDGRISQDEYTEGWKLGGFKF